jgi:hypothetical protein
MKIAEGQKSSDTVPLNVSNLLASGPNDSTLNTVSKLCQYRGDNPLYSVLVPNILGSQIHFLIYSVMLPNILGFTRYKQADFWESVAMAYIFNTTIFQLHSIVGLPMAQSKYSEYLLYTEPWRK